MRLNDIRKFEPCYDPARWCADENRDFTILDVLAHPEIPPKDKIWVATRKGFLPDILLRKFAIWCARQDESIKEISDYVDVIERFYIFGTSTEEEMRAADNAAGRAADRAADCATYSVAYRAANSAAHSAAYSAADSAAYRSTAHRKNQVVKLIELKKEGGE